MVLVKASIVIAISLWLSFSLKAQDTIQKTYHKKTYEQTDRKNARFVKLIIQDTGDVVRYETRTYPYYKLISRFRYKDSIPVGIWFDYPNITNYDFELIYSEEDCGNGIGYNVVTKRTSGVPFSDSLYVPDIYGISVHFAKNIRYPAPAVDNRIEGMTVLRAFLNSSGEVWRVTVLKSSGSKLLDKEAVRAMREMPRRRKTFRLGGQNVEGCIIYPVKFMLR